MSFFCPLPLDRWLALSFYPVLKLIVSPEGQSLTFAPKTVPPPPPKAPSQYSYLIFITKVILCHLHDYSIAP